MDDLNSDASAAEILAKREKEKLENLKELELKEEEERLSLEEEVARLETILEHQELSQELKKKPYRKVSLPQQKIPEKSHSPSLSLTAKCIPWFVLALGKWPRTRMG